MGLIRFWSSQVECDTRGCLGVGPEARTEGKAIALATAAGFVVLEAPDPRRRTPGRYACPACVARGVCAPAPRASEARP